MRKCDCLVDARVNGVRCRRSTGIYAGLEAETIIESGTLLCSGTLGSSTKAVQSASVSRPTFRRARLHWFQDDIHCASMYLGGDSAYVS